MAACLWLLAALTMAVAASDSILDIIDTEEVKRLIAQRKTNHSRDPGLERNKLEDEEEDDYPEPRLRKNLTEELQEISRQGQKLLQSSKSALLVTKKEYLKKDWCKTEPLIQVIREEGCSSVTILNRFCYGQCNSFYIPKSPRRKGKAVKIDSDGSSFKSCAFCKPKQMSWMTVTLRCRKKKKPSLRRKRVLRVKQCKCITQILD
ncbi:gremlin-1-like [Homalodisca vitripennis]|uniref:gremlin-1-like n=1 Tax=Homalodisca vitripennis TaxID=197043 RepID=UPI001EEC4CCF|nr:gremlin-1-like [Homalodisca vitripennis]